MSESGLPSGTVTFLFTDIEGSTRLWEEHPDAMHDALARHDEILRDAVEAQGGHVVKGRGDGVHAVFATADAAVRAAIDSELAMAAEVWSVSEPLRARVGVHTGVAELRDGDYFGSAVNRAARLEAIAHGGQILCSHATADLAREVLAEGVEFVDLGEHRLRDLSRPERVFQVDAAGLQGEFGPLASVDAFPGNLPLQLTSFIGREHEIDQAISALSDARVVTLTGVGGVGKTRLAFQVAAEMLPRFREGAWLVELAPVRDSDAVVDSFAAIFGVTARAGQTTIDALVEFLGTKQLLLVVDNCEHVLDPVAEVVDTIARSCPGVVILTTSREVLTIPGERILGVPSLPSPPADADVDAASSSAAVALFVDRARAIDAAFALTSVNAASVVQICRRLDGIPLAIELAAARVHVMSPGELAAALDHRFEVLAGARRGAVKRQQTLRATIDWSYDLLEEPQQRLLARISVFAGGCAREAVEGVCGGEPIVPGSVFGLLTELVERSLVIAEHDGPDTRYRLLETIREYAEERLVEHGETDTLRNRHAQYYLELFQTLCSELGGPGEFRANQRLEAESENLHLAMAQAVDTANVDLALAFLDPSYSPLRFSLGVLALEPVADHPRYAGALATAARYAAVRGNLDAVEGLCQQALAAARRLGDPDRRVEESVTTAHAIVAFSVGAYRESVASFEHAADIGRSTGNRGNVAFHLGSAALFAMMGGDSDTAARLATEGLAAAREVGSPGYIAQNQLALAGALADADPQRAHTLLHEVVAQRASFPPRHLAAAIMVAAQLDDYDVALELAPRSIQDIRWTHDPPQLAAVLCVVARGVVDRDPDAAAVIQGAARTLAPVAITTGSGSSATNEAGHLHTGGLIVEILRETSRRLLDTLGEERLSELRERGTRMDIDEAVAYTLAHLDTFLATTD